MIAPSFRILNTSPTIGGNLEGSTTESQSSSITAVGSAWGNKHKGGRSSTNYHSLYRICYYCKKHEPHYFLLWKEKLRQYNLVYSSIYSYRRSAEVFVGPI